MSEKVKKYSNKIVLLFLVFSIFFITIPHVYGALYVAEKDIPKIDWKYVTVKNGYYFYYGDLYPKLGYGSNNIEIQTPGDTKAYLEKEFKIPRRDASFSLDIKTDANVTIYLIDNNGNFHFIGASEVSRMYKTYLYDISPYGGQKAKIRIYQSKGSSNLGYATYKNLSVETSLWGVILNYLDIVIYIISFSAITGLMLGYSGFNFVTSLTDKFHEWTIEKRDYYSKNKKWYSKYYLKYIFFILNKTLHLTNKVQSSKLKTGLQTSILIAFPILITFITGTIVYLFILTVITIVKTILYILIILFVIIFIIGFILSILGLDPSGISLPSFSGGSIGGGGGGSSSGRGGGRSSSSSGAIFGNSDEETAKEESRPFKVDKETKSSEGALPFGLGGDTIYKTEYEDTSTGETVKGHGWTRSEADFNARKNLKNK